MGPDSAASSARAPPDADLLRLGGRERADVLEHDHRLPADEDRERRQKPLEAVRRKRRAQGLERRLDPLDPPVAAARDAADLARVAGADREADDRATECLSLRKALFFLDVARTPEGPGLPPTGPPPIERLQRIAPLYGMEILGPPLAPRAADEVPGEVNPLRVIRG